MKNWDEKSIEDISIDILIKSQKEKHPNKIAISCNGKSISYNDLYLSYIQFASFLLKNGIVAGDVVAISMDRSIEMVISMLGLLKIGAAYIPLDLKYPIDRKRFLIEDCKAKAIIIDSLEYNVTAEYTKTIVFDSFWINRESFDITDVGNEIMPNNLAYILYTSGSTGKPKGVQIQQKSLINLLLSIQIQPGISEEDSLLAVTVITFDIAQLEIFLPLISGAKLYIGNEEVSKDGSKIIEIIKKEKITIFQATPFTWRLMLEFNWNEQLNIKAFIGGEALTKELAHKLLSRVNELWNMYGPTETTIYSVIKKISVNDEIIAIGKPILNTQIYILSETQNIISKGEVGEICIGGLGVGEGYINRPDLTANSFIEDKFSGLVGRKIYRTGDLGILLENGDLQCLGRIDHQIKIRGFRVETEEVEVQLMQQANIKHALLIAHKDEIENIRLIAYIVTNEIMNEKSLQSYIVTWKAALQKVLPDYMIPVNYMIIDTIPLLSNGKVNRKALPPPVFNNYINEYRAPETELEKQIAEIWEKALSISNIGLDYNFFELGGDSLNAIKIMLQIEKLTGVRLGISIIFKNPTIQQIVTLVNQNNFKEFKSIQKIEDQLDYEISAAQKRLWILHQFDNAKFAYNLPIVITLEGALDKDALETSLKNIVNRHESLRTVFIYDSLTGNPRQKIVNIANLDFKLEQTNITNISNKEDLLKSLCEKDIFWNFDLNIGPLFRCHLIQIELDKYLFVAVQHHIISDGWSIDIFRKELSIFYNAIKKRESANLSPLKIQYKDYTIWHNNELSQYKIEINKQYWIKQFEGELPLLELSSDKERPKVKTYNGASIELNIEKETLDLLNRNSKELGGTLFMGLLSCIYSLLFRYTGQEDIIIGSPAAGREHSDLEDQIGFFVNTLALRARFDNNISFNDLFQIVKRIILDAYENQIYPYNDLVEVLKISRDMSHNPLFDIMVVYENTTEQEEEYHLNGLKIDNYKVVENRISKFDITFTFIETKDELKLVIDYNTDIYSKEKMLFFSKHCFNIIKEIAKKPHIKINEIEFITEEEINLFEQFNIAKNIYPKNKTVVHLFEEQVIKTPDNIAVFFEGIEISYSQLNYLSNQVADYLRKNYFIQPDDLIGIKLRRNEWMVITILGILKSGAAYLPLDPDYPQDRLDYMVKDSNCKLQIDLNELETIKAQLKNYNQENQQTNLTSHNLIYCIYTSGSTGNPKGVLLEHHTIINLIYSQIKEFCITEDERILQFASINFDASVEQFWIALLSGARLMIINNDLLKDLHGLENFIVENKVTHIHAVPAYLNELTINNRKFIKRILSGGDTCPPSLVRNWINDCVFYNKYGPTETTVTSIEYKVTQLKEDALIVPIGKPISNTQILILDSNKNLMPFGCIGEIYIGGDGLARGYLNRPDLNTEKFIQHPFKPEERLYRTGDLAKWLPDGNIEYLGRIDDQVKIRGYRIELGEITSVLLKHPLVNGGIVIARAINGQDKELIAYFTGNVESFVLRDYLKEKLPSFMVPNYFLQLNEIPLTSNGKINKKVLPLPEESGINVHEYTAPSNNTEKLLVQIWSSVLNIPQDRLSVNDNFFDIGGHSIKAIKIMAEMFTATNTRFPISILFQYPTIKELSLFVDNKYDWPYKCLIAIKPTGKKDPLYIVHGIGLNLLNLQPLIMELDIDQPVFGLQALGLDGSENEPLDRMDKIAAYYISEIIKHNPNGPYVLAGYSFGGIIAYEMVSQLKEMGKEVRLLIMFDTVLNIPIYQFNLAKKIYIKVLRQLYKLKFRTKSFLKYPYKNIQFLKNYYVNHLFIRTINRLKGDYKKSNNKDHFQQIVNNLSFAKEQYIIKPKDIKIEYIKPEERLNYIDDPKYFGWKEIALKGISVYEVPGEHETMFESPNNKKFAETLQKILNNTME